MNRHFANFEPLKSGIHVKRVAVQDQGGLWYIESHCDNGKDQWVGKGQQAFATREAAEAEIKRKEAAHG